MKVRKSKLPRSIKRITVLKSDGEGRGEVADKLVVKKKSKKKKQTKGLKIWDRIARRSAEAQESTADSYLGRHRRSNRKRRDGWLRDYGYNWMRAGRKGGKKFKLSKIFG